MQSKNSLDISVIVPFHNLAELTLDCIKSLLKFGPSVKEILLVSNNSNKPELDKIRAFSVNHRNISILEYNKPFNYQVVNNWAVSKTSGSFILFLNNDTELREHSRGLLEYMYKKAAKPDVGIVGCLLLYGDERIIQHGGVYLVSGRLADHMYVGESYAEVLEQGGKVEKYPYDISKDLKMTAVTGAVSLVEKKKFLKVSGFDERFILCGGDVDLCIRLNKAGYQTWFASNNGQYILHKESQSRAFKPVPFNDFYYSYLSYKTAYDEKKLGDKYLPKICELMEVAA